VLVSISTKGMFLLQQHILLQKLLGLIHLHENSDVHAFCLTDSYILSSFDSYFGSF
jgi:hypothetical protein